MLLETEGTKKKYVWRRLKKGRQTIYYMHEEEWPKRHSHSAGPNGGQPVSGHLLLALLPLQSLRYFILFVCFVTFSFSLSLLSCQVKTNGNCARLVFRSSCHVQMGTSQQIPSEIKTIIMGKRRTYLKIEVLTRRKRSHTDHLNGIEKRGGQHS